MSVDVGKCPFCGGPLRWDGGDDAWFCDACEEIFTPTEEEDREVP